ncbi:MAG: hypothetical protein CMH48_02985 [Muricauda sp.]|nr:DUF4369 domain-containing protein [Allomuricauda sp.]MAU26009.1 hypothetical protein [Allomuricauda sp.]MBC29786.1 hypothetical protein [Allomuricauda sp.]|tara:strand:+ start:66480 stop:67178 length:699 start_codon:yes stop_codon:yes gene_type:complete
MRRYFTAFALILFLISCGGKSEKNMTVSGTIDGLKKGTLYLQHIKDSSLATIDSLELRGDGSFTFSHEVESPELFYLYLKKADNNDINDRITFFGEPGEIFIKTKWNAFDALPEISGSASHETYSKCLEMLSKFNKRELELSRAGLSQEIQNDSMAFDSIIALSNRNIISKYRYVLNFALNNPDSYVTPYLALHEASDANPKYLDSINRALVPEVAQSKYGRALNAYVQSIK